MVGIKLNHLLSIALCTGIMLGSGAHAQSIDYSGLEEVFGEPVTVSATGKPQRVSEVPLSMDIITADQIRRSGALDIPQILRRYAGVDVVRNFKGQADVNIRGYNQPYSNRLLVLVNGRQVYQDNYGMTLWHSFPVQLSEVKQIEIVRGPNTSLFGFNASSGVINIVTFNPLYDDVNVIEARVGQQDHRELNGATTYRSDRYGIRVSAGKLDSDGYSRLNLSPYTSEEGAIDKISARIDTQIQLSDITSLRFESGYNNQSSDSTAPFYIVSDVGTITRSYKVGLTHETENSGVWSFQAYRNEVDLTISIKETLLAPLGELNNRLNVVQASNLMTLGTDHTLRTGVEFRNNELEGPETGTGQGQFAMNIYSTNAMWDWKINDTLSTTHAVRVDYWETNRKGGLVTTDTILGISADDSNQDNTEFSFNSALVYKPDYVSTYRVSAARGLHIPSLNEMGQSTVGTTETYGNPHLDTETNTTVELGYMRSLPSYGITVGTDVFYERMEDIIVTTEYAGFGINGNTISDLTYENAGDSESVGVELSVQGKLLEDTLSWNMNYSYLVTSDSQSAKTSHYLDFETNQPRHKVNLALAYDYEDWEFNTDLHYVSGVNYSATVLDFLNPRRTNIEVPDYLIMNASVRHHVTDQFELAIEGFNLIDDHHERPSMTLVTGAGTGGSNEIGRTVMFKMRYSF